MGERFNANDRTRHELMADAKRMGLRPTRSMTRQDIRAMIETHLSTKPRRRDR